MRLGVGCVSTVLGIVVMILSLLPDPSTAEDFLERMKKAAEQLEQQQQRQRLQQQSQSQRQGTTASPQTASSQTPAQSVQEPTWINDCCTPEATAKMAGSAGVVDIVGIKVGINATYSWVDQVRQGQADKKLKEADKVDRPKF